MDGTVGRARPGAEFALLYRVAPVAMAILLPPSAMFPALFAVTAVGLVLLHVTPGFFWRDLARGWSRISLRLVLLFAAATVLCGYLVLAVTAPDAMFGLARSNPGLLAVIALLYPVLSALPQEIVFRPLFFRRYGPILPPLRAAIVLNAAVFAWSYEARRSFPEAVVLHAVAGVIAFALGLGVYFHSGNVVRPF